MALPASFKVGNVAAAGVLPSTDKDPMLDPKKGTDPVKRSIKVSWDCCGKDKKTKIVERTPGGPKK